jgi:dipeptidyl aminopeptidase/acylaminoacyl peptidase
LLGGPYHLTGVASAGPVVRAAAAIGIAVEGVPAVLALDADRHEFVHAPGLPAGTANQVVLSDDGRRLLLIAPHGTPPHPILPKPTGLCVHDLASGRQRWYPGDVDGRDVAAALSPDGTLIASLCTPWDPDDDSDDSGLAAIGLTDTATGQRRRLWATRGGHCGQSTISWSPAGRYIAVTYLVYVADREDVYCQTSVVDLAGNLLWQRLDAVIPRASNGAWLGEHHLVAGLDDIVDDEMYRRLVAVDVTTGQQRLLVDGARIFPTAVLDSRFIIRENTGRSHSPWVTTNLDYSQPEPLLIVEPTVTILGFDIARRANSAR